MTEQTPTQRYRAMLAAEIKDLDYHIRVMENGNDSLFTSGAQTIADYESLLRQRRDALTRLHALDNGMLTPAETTDLTEKIGRMRGGE